MKIKIRKKEKEDLKSIIELLDTDKESNVLLAVSLIKKYRRFYKYIWICNSNSREFLLCKHNLWDYFDSEYYVIRYSDMIKEICVNNTYLLVDFLKAVINEVNAFYQK